MCGTLCNQNKSIISILHINYMHTLHIKLHYTDMDSFGLLCVYMQTVNFTLRSTLHNIDFGLDVDGVTFYDCSVRDK